MAITIDPNMTLPVEAMEATGELDSAMSVTFAVPVRNWQVNLSISLCIRITIGGLTVSIYYNKQVLAAGQNVMFEALLPIGAEILDTKATYNRAYPM